jgi:uncharacterized protein
MRFLDRTEEKVRLSGLFARKRGGLGVLYGRRRCGKSRLLAECLPRGKSVCYVGDEREDTVQRTALAREVARILPGFDKVNYPDWESLLARWWEEAAAGSVLALDEFPALVSAAGEIPSLLQKRLDSSRTRAVHLVLSGSSQQMMRGLVLDRTAPLYGRGDEILKIEPLRAGWIRKALHLNNAVPAVEAYAVWGGVPRYWELASNLPDLDRAIEELVLSPLGVLHDEPATLLREDLRETAQAASILNLIGQGAQRSSEIAARLAKPATSLSRPLGRLTELGLVRREIPFGASTSDGKRTLYRIQDPFLRFWFRFVEPNYSLLESRRTREVMSGIRNDFAHHVGGIWEELAQASVPLLGIDHRQWGTASRWWGAGLDRKPMELDIVAESHDRKAILLGEVEWSARPDVARLLSELRRKVGVFPRTGQRTVHLALWLRDRAPGVREAAVVSAADVLKVLV